MFFRRRKETPQLERLNIVPIMDAVFIFIFFLFFSAQFVKIFEIETEAPVVSEVPSDKKLDDEPLNLIIKVFKNRYEIFTGVDQNKVNEYFKDNEDHIKNLKNELMKLRLSYPKDDQAIISPKPDTEYADIVKTIDIIQTIPKGQELKVTVKDEEKVLKKIFTQIVLESMDEI